MDIPYEKMYSGESMYKINKEKKNKIVYHWILIAPSSSMLALDAPVHIQPAPVRIRHYFVFSLFSAICLCPATGNQIIEFNSI